MTQIKLTNRTNISLSHLRTTQAEEAAAILELAERRGSITVHSHGKLLDEYIWQLEAALESAKAFRLEVQGR